MRRASALSALPAVLLALGGCVILDLVMLPLTLIFDGVGAVAGGVSSLVALSVTAKPIEGPAPTVTPLEGGRWMVEAPAEPARFRVSVSAAGHETREFTWPDDLRRMRADEHGVALVECVLAPVSASTAASTSAAPR